MPDHGRRNICGLGSAAAFTAIAGAQPAGAGILDFVFGDGSRKKTEPARIDSLWKWSREARHYTFLGHAVECALCPNRCKLDPGFRSRCKVRVHKDGKLYTLVYGNPAAVHIDPVEKKPLYHFYPGTTAFSLGFAGCNFECLNCQNWELSQSKPEKLRTYSLFPDEAVKTAGAQGCASIAYTYNEPSVVFEYMYDTAKAARGAGIRNVWVTNGYMNPEPLGQLGEYLDAANVDLKAFSDKTYQKLNAGRLQPVLDTLMLLKNRNVWLEITALVVPTHSDDPVMFRDMCRWIRKSLGPECPLHISRFRPEYKLENLLPTPPSVLTSFRDIAREEGLLYVYIGNYRPPDGSGADTLCPKCRKPVLQRVGFTVTVNRIEQGACASCKHPIAGRWAET